MHNPEIGKLVERQMRNWELARSQRATQDSPTTEKVADFICLSREVGVGANRIGALLGERLGWPVFEKEILHHMAGDDGQREQIFASMDERDVSWCEEVLRSLMQPEFVKNDYFHTLCKTILALARQGSAIFIGRRADLVLPSDVGLRVRIIAPLAMRIQRLVERRCFSAEAAEQKVARLEEKRAGFTRQYFRVDPHDPQSYDLVINLKRFSFKEAVELILSAHKSLSRNEPVAQPTGKSAVSIKAARTGAAPRPRVRA
jgi:cytidylate kinase